MSPSPFRPGSRRLYAVCLATCSAPLIVDTDGTVIAASRVIAGWALGRTLPEVEAAAAQRGAELLAVNTEPDRLPVPA